MVGFSDAYRARRIFVCYIYIYIYIYICVQKERERERERERETETEEEEESGVTELGTRPKGTACSSQVSKVILWPIQPQTPKRLSVCGMLVLKGGRIRVFITGGWQWEGGAVDGGRVLYNKLVYNII